MMVNQLLEGPRDFQTLFDVLEVVMAGFVIRHVADKKSKLGVRVAEKSSELVRHVAEKSSECFPLGDSAAGQVLVTIDEIVHG